MSQYLVLAAVLASLLLLPPSSGDNPQTPTTLNPNRIYYPDNLVQNPLTAALTISLGGKIHETDGYRVDVDRRTPKYPHWSTAAPASCRYWCKTPQGSFYCCRGGWPTTTPPPVVVKPGHCPPVRPVCPRNYGPPVPCVRDAACTGVDKCCFDVCLQQTVCKPPEARG